MTLCVLTATALSVLSLGFMAARRQVMGGEIDLPAGPNTWKVTLTVQGQAEKGARVWTSAPLDVHHQHVVREKHRSGQMEARTIESKDSRRRTVLWSKKPGAHVGAFKLHAEFYCSIDLTRPTAPMEHVRQSLNAPPAKGHYLEVEPRSGPDRDQLTALACLRAGGKERLSDKARAVFDYVSREIINEPSVSKQPVGPVQCLADGSGDAAAKSSLLLALLRVQGIQARLVSGVTLIWGARQSAHTWVEAWLHDRWVPMCPFHHHYGKVPSTYLIFAVGERALVRSKRVRDLDYGFLVERCEEDQPAGARDTLPRKFFRTLSLYMLPPNEQRLVQFLLLMPVAALIICVWRNLIGMLTFGTFTPALVGLAFRDLHSLPGIVIFVGILLVGWLLRRVLDRYHLLQVPRIAFMLSMVVLMLVFCVLLANRFSLTATRYINLFPLVILTGMIERFWTLEAEDGAFASFKTLLATLLVSASITLILSLAALTRHLFRYPETLGLVMAAQLLIGRYTGYRLRELFRFKDFLNSSPRPAGEQLSTAH
jgi:hypothetical protein